MHLLVDGYGGDYERMCDAELIYRFLDQYPASIGMTKITPPQVYTYRGPVPDDWGLSGFVIIAESHISVHTFPERRYINIDVFSCKEFDAEAALRGIKEAFALPEVKVWTLERGLNYAYPSQAKSDVAIVKGKLAEEP